MGHPALTKSHFEYVYLKNVIAWEGDTVIIFHMTMPCLHFTHFIMALLAPPSIQAVHVAVLQNVCS